MKDKIVVMGGSFNPPTIAHLKVISAAIETIGAREGIFVPAKADEVTRKMKRLKRKKEVISETERVEMLLAMSEEDSRLRINTCEFDKGEKWRTYETLEFIGNENPESEIWMLVGGDKVLEISHWHRVNELLERFKILITTRDEFTVEEDISRNPFLKAHSESIKIMNLPAGIEGVSSTKVRDLLRVGDETAAELVHPKVWEQLKKLGWLKLDITSFKEDYEYLSNFYEVPVEFDGLTYGNSEAAFQAQKCKNVNDRIAFTKYRSSEAKRAGRRVELRSDWDMVKKGLMKDIVRAKFKQNPELKRLLLSTGNRQIIEGNNWHDIYWGVDNKTGEGENNLGKILMEVREELNNDTNITYFPSTIMHIAPKKALIQTISDIVYAQKPTLDYDNVLLYMDIWRPKGINQLPVALFVTGGGFIASNRARLPQLRMFLAEAGYCVASISYRVTPEAIFPAPIEDVKSAIRYLKAHADDLYINPEKISVIGDSAGGYLASFVGVTNGITEFDKGDNLHVSSVIQAAINLYGPTDLSKKAEGLSDTIKAQYASAASTTSLFINGIPGLNRKNETSNIHELMRKANPINYINEKSAPMLLMHGAKDQVISPTQTDILYQELSRHGIEAHRYIIPEAGHASHIGSHWVQDEVLQVILNFLDMHLK